MEVKNYLFDLYPNFPKGFTLCERQDPDSCSDDLYDDLEKVFFHQEALERLELKSVGNRYQNLEKGDFYTIFLDKDRFLISSDYIGASVYWAQRANLSEEEIICYLKTSRTLGGHMVFPRGKGMTVNQARGGSKGYHDRFDLTLFAIKKWYGGEHDTVISDAIENYKEWFDLYKGFDDFIAFFVLEDFLSEDGKIIDLVKSDLKDGKVVCLEEEDRDVPKERPGYKRYFENSNKIIEVRTEKLISRL